MNLSEQGYPATQHPYLCVAGLGQSDVGKPALQGTLLQLLRK